MARSRLARESNAETSAEWLAQTSMVDRASIEAAYDRACRQQTKTTLPADAGTSGGGFMTEDAMRGDFGQEASSGLELRVEALPHLLRSLNFRGSVFHEMQELLLTSAQVSSIDGARVIPRAEFVHAVGELWNERHGAGARRTSHRPRKRARGDNEYESEGHGSSSEYTSFIDDDASDYDSDKGFVDDEDESDDDNHSRTGASRVSRVLSKKKREHARFLFRLLLERIPLVVPSALQAQAKGTVRTDVTEEELDTRRIGIDELRFAAKSLGELPSTQELAEMLYEASTYGKATTIGNGPDLTDPPRIGLAEYVAPLTLGSQTSRGGVGS